MLPRPQRTHPQFRWLVLFAAVLLVLVFGRSICSLVIDYQWWKEMGQLSTWARGLTYVYSTNFIEWLLVFIVLWIAHARGMKYARARLRDYRIYSRLATLALAF